MLGALVALATIGLPAASFVFDWRLAQGSYAGFAYGLLALGGLLSVLNCYLSWLRPLVHKLSAKPDDEYRFVSGIPMLGMLTLPGLLLSPPNPWTSGAVLVAVLADTGNALWFVLTTWSDESLRER